MMIIQNKSRENFKVSKQKSKMTHSVHKSHLSTIGLFKNHMKASGLILPKIRKENNA